jgi:hypothetical protein
VVLAGNSQRASHTLEFSEDNIKKDILVSKDRLSDSKGRVRGTFNKRALKPSLTDEMSYKEKS